MTKIHLAVLALVLSGGCGFGVPEQGSPEIEEVQAVEAPSSDARGLVKKMAVRARKVQAVRRAMEALALTEHTTVERLTKDPDAIARSIVEHADAYKIDPFVLVAIAWSESRFRTDAKGDMLGGEYRSCGITQIRTDFKGRPTCEQLMDPHFALGWTASHLSATASTNGYLRLNRYNGGDYEVRIWRKVDWLRREVQGSLPA